FSMPLLSPSINKETHLSNTVSFEHNQLYDKYHFDKTNAISSLPEEHCLQYSDQRNHNVVDLTNENKHVIKKAKYLNHYCENDQSLKKIILKPKYRFVSKETEQKYTNSKSFHYVPDKRHHQTDYANCQIQDGTNYNNKRNLLLSYQWDTSLFCPGYIFTPEKLDRLLRANSFLQNMEKVNNLTNAHSDTSKLNYDPESGKLLNIASNMLGFLNSGTYRSSDSPQQLKDMPRSSTPSVEDLNMARKLFVAARRESILSNKNETYF
ncbi:hypothetical protein MN116_000497, partial [Schistosoma mekongi]